MLTYATTGNKLGPFGFVSLTNQQENGPPEQPTNHAVSLVRPGVRGVAVRRNGVQPRPFVMLSGVDVLSFTHARQLLANYDAAGKTAPMQMVYGGAAWGIYAVLSVQLFRLEAVRGSGGFHGSQARAYLTTRWELVPVEREA